MDMTGGYASARAHAPQATIVIDNYHVVQLATKALEEVRREYWNELRQAGEADTAKRSRTPAGRCSRPDDLTEHQATVLTAIRRRREARTRLGDEGDGPRDLRAAALGRGRRERCQFFRVS